MTAFRSRLGFSRNFAGGGVNNISLRAIEAAVRNPLKFAPLANFANKYSFGSIHLASFADIETVVIS